jgi:hypothetical protein
MGMSRAAGRPMNGIASVACLVGVLMMGAIIWGGVIWVARAFLPLSFI